MSDNNNGLLSTIKQLNSATTDKKIQILDQISKWPVSCFETHHKEVLDALEVNTKLLHTKSSEIIE